MYKLLSHNVQNQQENKEGYLKSCWCFYLRLWIQEDRQKNFIAEFEHAFGSWEGVHLLTNKSCQTLEFFIENFR